MSFVSSQDRIGVVVVAAGHGNRFGSADKILVPLAGEPLIIHSIRQFLQVEAIAEIVVVLGGHLFDRAANLLNRIDGVAGKLRCCEGGKTRSESVSNGLQRLTPSISMVAVHDAARPLIDRHWVSALIQQAGGTCAIPAIPVSDSIASVDARGCYGSPVDRDALRIIQTPQIARREWLIDAIQRYPDCTDESSALQRAGYPVQLVEGRSANIKITYREDLLIAEALYQTIKGA